LRVSGDLGHFPWYCKAELPGNPGFSAFSAGIYAVEISGPDIDQLAFDSLQVE